MKKLSKKVSSDSPLQTASDRRGRVWKKQYGMMWTNMPYSTRKTIVEEGRILRHQYDISWT